MGRLACAVDSVDAVALLLQRSCVRMPSHGVCIWIRRALLLAIVIQSSERDDGWGENLQKVLV